MPPVGAKKNSLREIVCEQKIGVGRFLLFTPPCQKLGRKKRIQNLIFATFCEKNRVWGKQKKPPSLVPKMGKNAEQKFRCESKAESFSEVVIPGGFR